MERRRGTVLVNEAGEAVRRRTGSTEADAGAPPAPRPDAEDGGE